MKFCNYIDIVSESYNINFSDTSGIVEKSPGKYLFTVDGIQYVVQFYNITKGIFHLKFGPERNGRIGSIDLFNKYDISFTKEVMSNVAKCIPLFVSKYKPISMCYTTDRSSREKAYIRLFNMLLYNKELLGYTIQHKENVKCIVKDGNQIGEFITTG